MCAFYVRTVLFSNIILWSILVPSYRIGHITGTIHLLLIHSYTNIILTLNWTDRDGKWEIISCVRVSRRSSFVVRRWLLLLLLLLLFLWPNKCHESRIQTHIHTWKMKIIEMNDIVEMMAFSSAQFIWFCSFFFILFSIRFIFSPMLNNKSCAVFLSKFICLSFD